MTRRFDDGAEQMELIMRNIANIILASIVGLASATTASAQSESLVRPFAERSVADDVLSRVRGSGSPFALLTERQVTAFSDQQSQFDSRVFGTVGRVQMDVWWGSEGSELIATAVRAQIR